MLFDLWQRTLADRRDEVALRTLGSKEKVTFSCLQQRLDTLPPLNRGEVHLVGTAEGPLNFILQTLRAWRDGAVLFPVESPETLRLKVNGVGPEIAHLKITSGTTGEPRIVCFRGSQLVADAENIRASMKLNPAWPNLAVVSVAHSYGFSNLILPLLLFGHPLTVASNPLPGTVRQALEKGPVTLPAVPAMWRAWHQAGVLKSARIALAISAGAPLPLEMEQEVFDECGVKIHNFLGSSECGGIAFDSTLAPRADANFAGFVMSGVRVSLTEEQCILVEGPSVAEGYWRKEGEEGESNLGQGRFVASDLAELQGDAVFLRGRLTDAINVAGRKLNPTEVEDVLLTCEGVKHCVVFGIPSADPTRCEEAVACIHPAPGLTSERVAQWLEGRLPSWQMPKHFWFCRELEPCARGKISRRAWKEIYLNRIVGQVM